MECWWLDAGEGCWEDVAPILFGVESRWHPSEFFSEGIANFCSFN